MTDQFEKIAKRVGGEYTNGWHEPGTWNFTHDEFEAYSVQLITECVKAIHYASEKQLDTDLATVYKNAVASRFGYKLEHPYLTVAATENEHSI